FANISARTESRRFVVSLVASYGALSGLLLIFAFLSTDPGIHDGWVLMASVPPAIAVVPITSYLRGDTRRTVVSLATLYLIGPLLSRPELLPPLGLFSVLRTFGIGILVVALGRTLRLPRDDQVALAVFASFKNLGLTVVLAFSVFGPIATLPSIVSLVCEILW